MEINSKILICDENSEERRHLAESLTKAGYRFVEQVSSGDAALSHLEKNTYDVVIVDLWVSGIDGIGLIRARENMDIKGSPAFILMSPINKPSILMEASEAGADLCILKPFDITSLSAHIDSLSKIKSRNISGSVTDSSDMETQVTKIIQTKKRMRLIQY